MGFGSDGEKLKMYQSNYDSELKLWSGRQLLPMYNPKVSFGEIIFRALLNNPSRIAQISDDCGIQMTFDDIKINAIRAAENLQRLGYKSNDVFAIMARNSKDVAPVVFAALFNGCALNTLDPNFGTVELSHMLKTTKPCLIFCDLDVYDLVAKCVKETGMNSIVLTFGGQKSSSKSVDSLLTETGTEDQFVPLKVNGEKHVALILCSSGTSGLTKGVCLTHEALAHAIGNYNLVNCDDVMLCFSPLYWITGILTLFAGTLKNAKRIITIASFSPELQLRLINEYKITFLISPPFHLVESLKCDQLKTIDLTSVSCQMITGSKVPIDLPEQWNKYLKKDSNNCCIAYGTSELGGPVTIGFNGCGKEGSVGRIVPGFSLKIIDENGQRCGPNEDGEICIKSVVKFFGYFDNEKAKQDSFDSEDFMLTGDVGHFDDDGFLYFSERRKDILRYRGYMIAPSEIEDFLIQNAEIESVCVVGIPDGIGSDIPTAVVIRRQQSNITEDEISQLVGGHFADYYKLRGGVYFVESFPLSSSGKLLRRNVREIAIGLFNQKNIE